MKDDLSIEIPECDDVASRQCVLEVEGLLEEFFRAKFGCDQSLHQQNYSFSTLEQNPLNLETSMDSSLLCYKVDYNQHFKESILAFKQDVSTFRSWNRVLHHASSLVCALITQINHIWLIFRLIQVSAASWVLLLPCESFLIWLRLLKFLSLNLSDCMAITRTYSSTIVSTISLPSNFLNHVHTFSNDPSVDSKHSICFAPWFTSTKFYASPPLPFEFSCQHSPSFCKEEQGLINMLIGDRVLPSSSSQALIPLISLQ